MKIHVKKLPIGKYCQRPSSIETPRRRIVKNGQVEARFEMGLEFIIEEYISGLN